jgi:hypothetical protein
VARVGHLNYSSELPQQDKFLLLLCCNLTQLQEFQYVRDMNLNTIRLEGKMEDENYYKIADEMGILLMPGWCCCDAWQHWDLWKDEQYHVATGEL